MRAPASRKSQVITNLVFHYTAMALVLVQGIVLTPLYLHYVSPGLYGAWQATGNLLAWIQLVDPGISRIMQQRVAHIFGQRLPKELAQVIGTGMLLGMLMSALPLLAIPFSGVIASTLSLPPHEQAQLAGAVRLALIGTCLTLASFQPTVTNISLQMSLQTGFIITASGICGIVSTILFLKAGFGLASLPLGLIVRSGILLAGNTAILAVWCLRFLSYRPGVSLAELRRYAALSAFTFIERLGGTLLVQSESFLGAKMIAPVAAATYSLTSRGFDPVGMAAGRLAPAFLPSLAHLAGEGDLPKVTQVVQRLQNLSSFVMSVGAASVLALNFAFVSVWVGPQHFGGQLLTVAIACAVVMNLFITSLGDTVFAVGGVGQTEIARLAEGVVRLGMQILMVRFFGLIGLPLGTCAGVILVGGWYMPRLAARLFHEPAKAEIRRWRAHVLRAAGLLAVAMALNVVWRMLPHWTWFKLGWAAVTTAFVVTGTALLLYPDVREELRFAARRFVPARFLGLPKAVPAEAALVGDPQDVSPSGKPDEDRPQ